MFFLYFNYTIFQVKMQFFYISSKNLIENKIMPATKPYLNNECLINFELYILFKELKLLVLKIVSIFLIGFN